MSPGDLIKLRDHAMVVLHSDWCWQQEDSGCRWIDSLRKRDVGLIIAIVTCGYPRPHSQQLLILTPRGTFGWQSPVYFVKA